MAPNFTCHVQWEDPPPPMPPPQHCTEMRLFHLPKFIHAVFALDQWFSNCGACPPRGALLRGGGVWQAGSNFSRLVFSVFDSEDHKGVINIYKTTTRFGRWISIGTMEPKRKWRRAQYICMKEKDPISWIQSRLTGKVESAKKCLLGRRGVARRCLIP